MVLDPYYLQNVQICNNFNTIKFTKKHKNCKNCEDINIYKTSIKHHREGSCNVLKRSLKIYCLQTELRQSSDKLHN